MVLGARHSTLAVRKEAADGAVAGRVYTTEPTGDITYAHIHLGEAMIVASVAPEFRLAPDEAVWIGFDQERLHLFDGKTGQALAA